MENRVALIGIIVENYEKVDEINSILHENRHHIIGRMGLPYREKDMCIISIVVDTDNDTISALTGRLGMLDGITVKTIYSKK